MKGGDKCHKITMAIDKTKKFQNEPPGEIIKSEFTPGGNKNKGFVMKEYQVLMRTDNDVEFFLTVWAFNESNAESRAKQLSQGCMVLGMKLL